MSKLRLSADEAAALVKEDDSNYDEVKAQLKAKSILEMKK
jgi:hypothetical protein